jgi:hypothetical protein
LFAAYLRRFAALPFDYGKASWSLLQGEKETRRRFGKQKALLDWLEGK